MNSSESRQPLWDPQQITFAMPNRFRSLSETPPQPSHLPRCKWTMSGCMECQPRFKWKIQVYVTLGFKFWEGTSVKIYKTELPVFLFLVLHQFLYHQISFLQLSRISFNIIWKRFSSQIFLKRFTLLPPTPSP